MMTVCLMKEPTLCEICSQPKLYDLAHEIDPTFQNEKGEWIGGFSQENLQKSRAAYEEATKRLLKPCVQVYLDCEWGVICKDCLQDCINMFDAKECKDGK